MKKNLSNFVVLLNGPVKNALFFLLDRYRNVSVWFMARNMRFPDVGTHGYQRGNQRVPLQATARSHLGIIGCHCKELLFPRA